MKVAIVAPCHIPVSDAWTLALKAEAEANGARVIIVDDSDGKLGTLPDDWEIYGYAKQEEFLGELYPDFARLFHKSSACRIFGHLVALRDGADAVIGLDSDCIVKKDFVRDHIQFLNKPYGSGWFNPIGYPHHTRGYPYSQREWPIVANMGLWENVLDINGRDRQSNEPKEIKIQGSTVPSGPFPFSGMNFALTREAIAGFFFLPNFKYEDSDFRRIDDIWGGYVFQKMMRIRHESAMVGYPVVFHDTVVVPEEDAAEEAAMYEYEDRFIANVDECFNRIAPLRNDSYRQMFEMLSRVWPIHVDIAFDDVGDALYWWVQALRKYATV